jgi:hypothetical protein
VENKIFFSPPVHYNKNLNCFEYNAATAFIERDGNSPRRFRAQHSFKYFFNHVIPHNKGKILVEQAEKEGGVRARFWIIPQKTI